jgi:hypothetical protein
VLFLAGFSPTLGGIIAHHQQNKEWPGMRLKLVILASVIAAVVGAGASIALVLGVFAVRSLSSPGLLAASTLLLPIATIVFASIFVYRHTARRRKLQAFLTALLATLLTLSIFILTSALTSRNNPNEPLQPGPHSAF